MTLEQLSAAATEGEWGCYPSALGHKTICIRASPDFYAESLALTNEADAAFICKLVNLYRTGQLVAVADDVVERVAELQLAAFLAGRGSVTSMKHGTRSAKPAPTMEQFRQMAIAAMKDTQP